MRSLRLKRLAGSPALDRVHVCASTKLALVALNSRLLVTLPACQLRPVAHCSSLASPGARCLLLVPFEHTHPRRCASDVLAWSGRPSSRRGALLGFLTYSLSPDLVHYFFNPHPTSLARLSRGASARPTSSRHHSLFQAVSYRLWQARPRAQEHKFIVNVAVCQSLPRHRHEHLHGPSPKSAVTSHTTELVRHDELHADTARSRVETWTFSSSLIVQARLTFQSSRLGGLHDKVLVCAAGTRPPRRPARPPASARRGRSPLLEQAPRRP